MKECIALKFSWNFKNYYEPRAGLLAIVGRIAFATPANWDMKRHATAARGGRRTSKLASCHANNCCIE